MYKDEIISEVWRNRDAYVETHNNNLKLIVADLQNRQKRPYSQIVDRRIVTNVIRLDRESCEFIKITG